MITPSISIWLLMVTTKKQCVFKLEQEYGVIVGDVDL
jgi:hypothetical protein